MADIFTDQCYYSMLGDTDLAQLARESDNHLVRILVDKWVGAKNAYSDAHANEVKGLEAEISDLESAIRDLESTIYSLKSELDQKDETE